jgi:tetratricopeptide (TPR) repeat protein
MKKGILITVIVLLCLLMTNIVEASELTDDYFDIATNYYNSNNYAKALEYLDLIGTIEPDNQKAKELRDKISPPPVDKTLQECEAAKALSEAKTPQDVVIVKVPQQNLDKVIYDSDYYNLKGQEFYNKKDFDSAIQFFHKSTVVNKRNARAYNNLGMSYWCKGNTEAAVKYFKLANSINKNYTQPLVNLSNLYKQLGDSKKQFLYLQKAIKINPNEYLAFYYLGEYYRAQYKFIDAINNYKESVKINPKFPSVYLSLGLSFFETEEFNYSILALKQYLELCPNSDFAYFLMSKAALALCHYNDAKTYIITAIGINDNNEYQLELAKIELAMQNYDAALTIFQKVLQAGDNAELFNYVGLCYYKNKNAEIAIVNFKKAIELDGLRPIYYYNLAQCYKSIGDKQNYVKYVNTATKINPISYQDYIDLSCIFHDNSNSAYAINSLNDAIKKYPDEKGLYLAKLKIYEAIGDSLNYNKTKEVIKMRFEGNEIKK